MERSSFFNATSDGSTYDRIYKAEDFADYFASFIGTGVFASPTSSLQVVSNDNMTISVSSGKAWINGYYYNNTESLTLPLELSNGVLGRIDRIVIRLDLIARDIKAYVLTGTPSSSPVAPELTRSEEVYELGLADITVGKGVLAVSQANIKDLRFNDNLCGIVKGTIEDIDTTDLFAQYEKGFEEYLNALREELEQGEEEFNNWFNGLKDIVSSGDFPVLSVNNKTGFVELKAQDINTNEGESLEEFKTDILETIEGLQGGLKTFTDDTTGTRYTIGIDNGLFYYKEVE